MDMLIGLGSACLLIRVGLALYATGAIRSKSAAGGVLRTIGDLCVSTLAFWIIGAAVLWQTRNGVLGLAPRAIAFRAGDMGKLFFLLTVVLIGTGIVAGAVAERARFFPLWASSILLAGLLIPMGANWAWTGWLARLGFIDSGGATWLHLSGAICAAAAAVAVGARTGKYHHDGSASMIPGHNVPLAGVGVLAMLTGWAPYLAGCLLIRGRGESAGAAAAAVILSAAAAGVAAMLLGYWRYGKPDVILTLMGLLGGLVAVTAGAGQMAAPWAVLIGAVAGVLVPLCAIWVDLIGRIDDPAGSIAVHGVGGIWGAIAAGLFCYGSAHRMLQIGVQLLGVLAIGLISLALSAALFAVLDAVVRLRATEADEFEGLDLAEHDIAAYPDFQQTMIKSYHLREA